MNVCIIGNGTMGKGLLQVFAEADFVEKIFLITRSEYGYKSATDYIFRKWEMALNRAKINERCVKKYKKKIFNAPSYSVVESCDFIIEAVTEDIDTKKAVLKNITHLISDKTIVATNTSSLSVTEIGSVMNNKENFIGLHFFNPAPIMRLTEVVSGIHTSQLTKDFAYDLSLKLGKSPIHVRDSAGFVVNRILIPMINEAIGIFAEGVATAEDIDTAMTMGANHPIGPLSLADLIGNDVCLSIMDVLHAELGDPKYSAHPLLREMVCAGKLGKKSGVGFKNYQL